MKRMIGWLGVYGIVAMGTATAGAQTALTYQKPPAPIEQLLEAPRDADGAAVAGWQDDAGGTAGDVPDDCRCGAAAVPAGGDLRFNPKVEWAERGAVRCCAATAGR